MWASTLESVKSLLSEAFLIAVLKVRIILSLAAWVEELFAGSNDTVGVSVSEIVPLLFVVLPLIVIVLQFVYQVPVPLNIKLPPIRILSDWLPTAPLKVTLLKSFVALVPPANISELLSKVTSPDRDIKLPLLVQSPPTLIL